MTHFNPTQVGRPATSGVEVQGRAGVGSTACIDPFQDEIASHSHSHPPSLFPSLIMNRPSPSLSVPTCNSAACRSMGPFASHAPWLAGPLCVRLLDTAGVRPPPIISPRPPGRPYPLHNHTQPLAISPSRASATLPSPEPYSWFCTLIVLSRVISPHFAHLKISFPARSS